MNIAKRVLYKLFPQKGSYLPYVKHKMGGVVMTRVPILYGDEDLAIAERVMHAYHKALKDENRKDVGDIWDLIQERHGDFMEVRNTPSYLSSYLSNMHNKSITFGVSSATNLKDTGMFTKDQLIILAEALGVLPYNVDGVMEYDSPALVKAIEVKMGINLALPNVDGGIDKLSIGDGYYVHRDFWSAYLAWLIKDYKSVAEIGGGIGKVAIYAKRLGVKNYAIYDLPIINLVQAWYLIKCGMNVVLYGETRVEEAIEILPYWTFVRRQPDVVLNADSFPEMDASIVTDYLKKIKGMNVPLISVNAEEEGIYGNGRKHLVVGNIAREVGLYRISRQPFWFSRNYAHEVYNASNR